MPSVFDSKYNINYLKHIEELIYEHKMELKTDALYWDFLKQTHIGLK